MYSRTLPLWMEHFPLGKRLLIVDGDNLILRPWEEVARVERFLKLPRYGTQNLQYKNMLSKQCQSQLLHPREVCVQFDQGLLLLEERKDEGWNAILSWLWQRTQGQRATDPEQVTLLYHSFGSVSLSVWWSFPTGSKLWNCWHSTALSTRCQKLDSLWKMHTLLTIIHVSGTLQDVGKRVRLGHIPNLAGQRTSYG